MHNLAEVLDLHKRFLNGDEGGKKAVLRGVDLYDTDLREVDLRGADLYGADFHKADLRGADLRGADLRGVAFYRASLTGADLRGANLSGANVNYASWPLWRGSAGVKVDMRIFCQLVDHVIAVDCDNEEAKKIQRWLRKNTTPSHAAEYLRGGE